MTSSTGIVNHHFVTISLSRISFLIFWKVTWLHKQCCALKRGDKGLKVFCWIVGDFSKRHISNFFPITTLLDHHEFPSLPKMIQSLLQSSLGEGDLKMVCEPLSREFLETMMGRWNSGDQTKDIPS
jgi:hypothetical protein